MSTFGSRPPTTASEFGSQEKLRYTAQYDPEPNPSSYAPGEVPLAPSKGVDAVAPGIKGRPLPTSANPLSYEDTVLIDQNSITVWSHRHTNFQRKLVLPLRGATFIAVNYRRFYRDPFLKFHYWGIDDGIFYLYYPAHTIYFLFSLLSSILAFLAAGFQSFSIQIAAWVISLLTIIIGFLAFYNFVNLRERKFKNTLPARITFFVSFAFHFACFVALAHAFRLQMGSTTASGCASFMASAVCVSCSGGNTSVNSPIAFGVCDDPVRIATPVSWIASWVATLAALPLGVLILGTVSIIPKFVTVCHVTINGYQSLGYPLILTVSIETGERIMTEFLHYRNALGYEEHKAHMGGYTYWIPAVLPLYAAMSNFLAGLFFYLPS